MTYLASVLIIVFFCTANDIHADTEHHHCQVSEKPILQVLGSGGPIADDGRASSGYLIWINGKSRILVDTGGGVFLRFGETGARFDDLDHIAISHFHTDHSTDLVALLKSGYFSDRSRGLSISGPSGGGDYPGTTEYLERLLGAARGTYAYLDGYLDGSAGLVKLNPVEVDPTLRHISRVYLSPTGDIEVFAQGVSHGPVPALAYRIQIGRYSIVFYGDQNGSSKAFVNFARDADVLVMHMPVPENISGAGRKLHAPPSVIGKIAAQTGTGNLVLSHFMSRSLANKEENLEAIRLSYFGSLVSANDLDCIEF